MLWHPDYSDSYKTKLLLLKILGALFLNRLSDILALVVAN